MLSQETVVSSPRYYYPNGDLVLLVADPSCFIAFKIHRRKLMEAATIFNDALSMNPHEDDKQYDGVPALTLSDTVHQVCLLLEGIYSPSSILNPPSCQDDLLRLDTFLCICDKYDARDLLATITNVLHTYLSSLLDVCDGRDHILPLDVYPTTLPHQPPPDFFLPEPCHLLSLFLQYDLTDLIAPASFYLYRISRASFSVTPSTRILPIPQWHHLPVLPAMALSQLRMDMAIQALYASVINMMGWSSHRCSSGNAKRRDACHAALGHYAKVYRAHGGHLTKTGLPLTPERRHHHHRVCRQCEKTFRYLVVQERERFIEALIPLVFGPTPPEAEADFANRLEGWIAPVEECAKAPWSYDLAAAAPRTTLPEEMSWTHHCWHSLVSFVF